MLIILKVTSSTEIVRSLKSIRVSFHFIRILNDFLGLQYWIGHFIHDMILTLKVESHVLFYDRILKPFLFINSISISWDPSTCQAWMYALEMDQ